VILLSFVSLALQGSEKHLLENQLQIAWIANFSDYLSAVFMTTLKSEDTEELTLVLCREDLSKQYDQQEAAIL
jgi:hypothetical protein